MPIAFHIDAERHRICTTLTGSVSQTEILAHYENLRREPAFLEGWPVVFDCSQVTDWDLSTADVRSLAIMTRTNANELTIVAPHPAVFGLARIYETLTEDRRNVRVVHSLEEADGSESCLDPKRAAADQGT